MTPDFRQRFSAIAHADLPYCNPIAPDTLDAVLDHLGTPTGLKVLDLGCGRADLLIRLFERFGATGVGVDLSEPFLQAGRDRIAARCPGAPITLHAMDLREYRTETGFDLVACVGGPFERIGATWEALQPYAKPGGYLLWGGPYWRRTPDRDYLAFLAMAASDYGRHDDAIREAAALGLRLVTAVETSQAEWDHYEDTYAESVERFVATHPDDRDAEAMLARIRPWRQAYLRWGRDTLGFGLYLFQAP